MRNRVTIHIAGETYTMLAEESETYMQEVADLVDAEISQARKIPGTSSLQSAVLAGCNLADRYLKAVEAADNLRGQMKNYLEEASQLRRELADTQRLLDELTETDGKRHGGKK